MEIGIGVLECFIRHICILEANIAAHTAGILNERTREKTKEGSTVLL